MAKTTVLTLCDYYLPGYKAGGPITTLANMVVRLEPDLEFLIVTRDHDLGSTQAYAGITPNTLHAVGGAQVQYLSVQEKRAKILRDILTSYDYDILYLNSLFSPTFTIWPLLLRRSGLIPKRPVILAPRGELFPGALSLKKWKKHCYLHSARTLRLYRGLIWQASSVHEELEIRRWFGQRAQVMVAPDLTSMQFDLLADVPPAVKRPGLLKVLFLSRICAPKNLLGVLAMLKNVRGRIELNIVGPLEEQAYWRRCQNIIRTLPKNITVNYSGAVMPAQVLHVMGQHDLFFLPTLGENFGHVILEALSASCPVLISDQTPWQGLEAEGAGWDLPLNRPELFQTALQTCVDMDSRSFTELRQRARDYAARYCSSDNNTLQMNRDLFSAACQSSKPDRTPERQDRRRAAA